MTRWRVPSDTGLLKDVLLCSPDYFEWQPINSVAAGSLKSIGAREQADMRRRATLQYREFVSAFEGAGVACHFVEPEIGMPYQVFTRDSSQVTPWGPVLTQLYSPQRRGEYAPVLDFYQSTADDPRSAFWRYCTAGTIEGGDISVVRPGLVAIGASGERTSLAGAQQFANWFQELGWDAYVVPFDQHFLHLDLLFTMVTEHMALAFVDALAPAFLDVLRARQIHVLEVSYTEAMMLGANVLALGRDRVISSAHSADLNARLRAEGIEVLDPELDCFTMGGGGPRCLSMPLLREAS